jgi:acyl-CoA reductase-like NAD-dependent aldehyde dehydrogenase
VATSTVSTIDRVYIEGAWVPSHSDGRLTVTNPATEDAIATVPDGDEVDVERAVSAAQRAYPAWSTTSIRDRVEILRAIHEGLKARSESLVEALAREMGSPLWFGRQVQVSFPLRNLELAIEAIQRMALEETVVNSLVVREPIGVVAAITPWNAPLHQIIAKVGAAMAAGCAVVLKPSEVAPLNAVALAEIIHDAGTPPGVFNVIFGNGVSVGEPLVTHPAVDMVTFTGSVRAGSRVAELAGRAVKKVTLELGGKSATILLDDAAFDRAADVVARSCFANTGQVCSAQSRLLVPRPHVPLVESLMLDVARTWVVGDPFSPGTRLGPLTSRSQYEKVLRYIQLGLDEGARLVCGGAARPPGFSRGFYVMPTIFADVTRSMTIAREEIFGPVLSIMPYDHVEEAIEIANSVDYGLSGGVWSANRDAAMAIARRLRTGQVIINGAPPNLAAPFGGYRKSGIGRENGRFGVEEFFQLKAIQGGV